MGIYGSRPSKSYDFYTQVFKSRRLDPFCSSGFSTHRKMSRNAYLRAIGSAHLYVSFLWNSENCFSPINGLKPIATKWVEPTALEKLVNKPCLYKNDSLIKSLYL